MKTRWDIFCTVVDNYGDIGVTWRLARQLAAEHGMTVRLWVDDLHAFARLCPMAAPLAARQWQQGVEVRHWLGDVQVADTAEVVIGAFGCSLPEAYLQALTQRDAAALWLNLEYLSAEDWVEGCHGLASPQTNGLHKRFFFPGFTAKTGGLLREANLLAERGSFEADPAARTAFLARLGVHPRPEARLISLFAYENRQLGAWLDALVDDAQPTHLLVPEGRIVADLKAWLGDPHLSVGEVREHGGLTLQILPFVSQDDYDRLLWCCDFNAVRGEDSFVRAQWAARPILWHIYVQEENAHWEKLEAFLRIYRQGLAEEAGEALVELWRAWNMDRDMGAAWRQAARHWPALQAHARQWCDSQAARPDLATALVQFYRNWI